MLRPLYAISVCVHICICIFYAYGIALPCPLGFISPMNVSGISNPYQSGMPSLSLHFQFLLLLKVYSHTGLMYTRLALSGHLAGAWQIMWVRMSIMGCFVTRVAYCRAVPMKRGLIAQPASDVWGRVQNLQASCKSREPERVCMSRRGIYSSFLCVNGSF